MITTMFLKHENIALQFLQLENKTMRPSTGTGSVLRPAVTATGAYPQSTTAISAVP